MRRVWSCTTGTGVPVHRLGQPAVSPTMTAHHRRRSRDSGPMRLGCRPMQAAKIISKRAVRGRKLEDEVWNEHRILKKLGERPNNFTIDL